MGKLTVVGIGPGNLENMTIAAERALDNAAAIVGYTVYAELVKPRWPDKEYFTTPMTKEADRCRMALEMARERDVALVCSGDSGIYGMAALVYQLRGEAAGPEIEIIPGLTAACSGGALLGAPLTHDFAVVSLSDRLTPWEKIEKRLECAAVGDYSIVLYNPKSKGRPDNLRMACQILLRYLPAERPCGIAQCIGREGEGYTLTTLGELANAPADMFSTIFIGNSQTMVLAGKLVTPRGYRNV